MQRIIDEYLAYTVSREGVLRPESVDLIDLTREVIAAHQTSGHGDGQSVPRFDVDLRVHSDALGDRGLLRQLFANLVGNAVKYARPGEPAYVRIRALPAGHPGWARILVEDKGVGLTGGESEAIFRPFYRSAKGSATSQGVGIGLALCQSIVTRHGGRIQARSNGWGGATFEFTLPLVNELAEPGRRGAGFSRPPEETKISLS